ncbi:MAG: trypsin-like peptidase domain-containing protein [Bacteroidales bacterium]|nr:trypsin-like peptidase domain-containing protein [Bacteroidales bacterium]
MRTKILLSFIFFFATVQFIALFAQSSDRDAARSVVKIKTTFKGPDEKGKIVTKIGNGTGWCYGNPRQVITALHVVAGIPVKDIVVYTDRQQKESGVIKVVRVLKEADLALLELDTDLGITPLSLADVDHNSTGEFFIWGYPHGIFHMAGDDVRFSRSLDPPPTLNSLVNNTDFKFILDEQQGYPLSKVRILRVSSTIQPGHSGAPILTKSGQVIGIADGGLRSGTARLNWAIPASFYIPKLLASSDPFPGTASLQANLYASYTVVPDNSGNEMQNKMMEDDVKYNIVGSGDNEITKTWSASYQEILSTMEVEDRNDISEITSAFNLNMNNTRYDVYEDYQTGATITIPAGETMDYSNGWFYTTNENNTLHYYAMIYDAGDFANAKTNAYKIFNHVLSMPFVSSTDSWYMDEDDADFFEEDDEWEYASYYITRYANETNSIMLNFNAEIDQNELLVVFMVSDLSQNENPTFLKQFLHYSIALNLAAFAGY